MKFKMQDLADKLEAVGVPAGPINNLDQVFDDPHVKHRGMKLDLPSAFAKAGTIPGVRTPIMVDGKPMASPSPPAARRAHGGNPERDRRGLEAQRCPAPDCTTVATVAANAGIRGQSEHRRSQGHRRSRTTRRIVVRVYSALPASCQRFVAVGLATMSSTLASLTRSRTSPL